LGSFGRSRLASATTHQQSLFGRLHAQGVARASWLGRRAACAHANAGRGRWPPCHLGPSPGIAARAVQGLRALASAGGATALMPAAMSCPVQVRFERRCDSYTRFWAPEDDEKIASGAKEDAELKDEDRKRQLSFFEIEQQRLAHLHGHAHKAEESLKPQVLSENVSAGMVARRDKLQVAQLHNPLDNWDHISASKERDCHICLTTHSSLWHLHLDLPTCHSCFVDLHR
jgi:hypothetical protein